MNERRLDIATSFGASASDSIVSCARTQTAPRARAIAIYDSDFKRSSKTGQYSCGFVKTISTSIDKLGRFVKSLSILFSV
jgi:hypothetical protein